LFALLWLRVCKLIVGLGTNLGRRALAHGVAPSIEHLELLKRLQARTIIDVGANRGQFALLSLTVCPNARIISFEPAEQAFQVLKAVTAGGPIRTVHAAIVEDVGELILNITEDDDSSSLLPIGDHQTSLFGTRVVRRETVQGAPLSNFVSPDELNAPALLKIDVQGAELAVLKGCRSLLDRFAWIYVECSFIELYQGQPLAGEVIAYLEQAGFILGGVFNQVGGGNKPAVQADILFMARPEA
jgi:FkbM family methyltransferase